MLNKQEQILNIIKTIRESFGGAIATYTMGNCYQFYEILKSIFSDAEAYYYGNHVWTKIDDIYYDIRGIRESNNIIYLYEVEDDDLIKRLSVNKWTDERRNEYAKEFRNKLLNEKNI